MFEDTKEVFRSRSLWELSKGLNIFLRERPTLFYISYHIVMKLPWVGTRFFSFLNYGTSVTWTTDSSNRFWQSLRVRASEVLLYTVSCIKVNGTFFILMNYLDMLYSIHTQIRCHILALVFSTSYLFIIYF
jgi:hypothetical protein